MIISEKHETIGESKSPKKRKVNIDCQGVYKIYKKGSIEVVALKNINLKVLAGELVVIMGPSGSGKTTLLNVISGMTKPSAGKVFVNDVDITKLKDSETRKLLQEEIGIVFQSFNLVPSLTAHGNVELPMLIAKKSKEYRKKKLKELIKAVDMENRIKHRPYTLSGGEIQRISIAAAFANEPTLVLADEPTGNIDSVSSKKVLELFKKFLENSDKSVIIVTHDSNIRTIADRTLVIQDGHIVLELGKIDEDSQNDRVGQNSIHEINANGNSILNSTDRINKVLNPELNSVKNFQEILYCPKCNSSNIHKKFDEVTGFIQIVKNRVITKAIIFCKDCNQMNFVAAAIYSIEGPVL